MAIDYVAQLDVRYNQVRDFTGHEVLGHPGAHHRHSAQCSHHRPDGGHQEARECLCTMYGRTISCNQNVLVSAGGQSAPYGPALMCALGVSCLLN